MDHFSDRVLNAGSQVIARYFEVGMPNLSLSEQVFFAIYEFWGEVGNSGLSGYYGGNLDGENLLFLPEAFDAIGASAYADFVRRVNASHGEPGFSADRVERARQLEQATEEQWERLESFEEELFNGSLPQNVPELLEAYFDQHLNDFQ